MKLVHLSDLHLGYRQYQRLTPGGINQREADVALTFQRAIDRIIEIAPDVILIVGDVFHSVRPTNQAILHAFIQLSRLRRELPSTDVVMIAGNHDTPRSSETGGILQLFAGLGINVVDREARNLEFPERDLSVLAIPDVPGDLPARRPQGRLRYNVLALHGEIAGMIPAHIAQADRAAIELSKSDLQASRWSYVALGHYHVYQEVEPNAFYSGSLDYTSVNTWGEKREEPMRGVRGKGFIVRDLETGAHRFEVLPASRDFIDLPSFSAKGMTVDELNARLRNVVEQDARDIDDQVVRLIIYDLPRHLARELDHKLLREYKRRALNFHLDVRRPETSVVSIAGAPGKRASLAELLRTHLANRLIDADIDREQLIARGLGYLDQAEHTVPETAAGQAI